MRSCSILILLLLGGVLLPIERPAQAHPISISSTLVDVERHRVSAEIQILLEDLVLYHGVKSGADERYPADALRAAAEKHREFLLNYFTIRDAQGNVLNGKIMDVETSQLKDGALQGELMAKSVVYGIEFPLNAQQEFLTFTQNFGGPRAVLPAVMDLMLLQNGILTETPSQLAFGRPFTARFDWDNPPAAPPQGLAELRKKRAAELQQRLGIASYSGLYSFIYITPDEVRHEILIPLLTLEQWLPIPRQNPDFLEVSEQTAARDAIASFFRERNPVFINGARAVPELHRLNFFSLDINDFALNAEPRRVGVFQARVGVILSCRPAQPPSEVRLRWETFHQHAPFLRSIVLVEDNDPVEHFFRERDPEFAWQGVLAQPKLHPAEKAPENLARLSSPDIEEKLRRLLENVYRAFSFPTDEAVYEALAQSAHGGLLRQLFLQIKRSLLMAEQGGAVSRIRTLTLLSSQPQPQPGGPKDTQTFRCVWRVTGTVEHWGHLHARENEYEALLSLKTAGGLWKFSSVEVLDEKRVRFETRLRGYDSNRKP